MDIVSKNPFMSKTIIKPLQDSYNKELAANNVLKNKVNQINAEIAKLQSSNQSSNQPSSNNNQDDYNKQLSLVEDLRKAQDALTHDPNSVAQEGKLADYQQKYSEAIEKLNGINKNLQNIQRGTEKDIDNITESIQNYRETLNNNQQLFDKYSQDIKGKMSLVATRDRMLQLSQERNVYKKKIINVLISIVVALLVAVVAANTFYGKMTTST